MTTAAMHTNEIRELLRARTGVSQDGPAWEHAIDPALLDMALAAAAAARTNPIMPPEFHVYLMGRQGAEITSDFHHVSNDRDAAMRVARNASPEHTMMVVAASYAEIVVCDRGGRTLLTAPGLNG